MKLTCLICDDDPVQRTAIEQLVSKTEGLKLNASVDNPSDAAAALQKGGVDVLFLDVEMPEMTGLELLRTLKNPPEVVLITAKEGYAVEAFDLAVADYLVKPVALPRFMKAVDRIRERLAADAETSATTDSLFVKANAQLLNVKLSDILFVEATGDYVTLHTERDKYVVHSTMKGIDQKLPDPDFIRVHRSYIVRIDKIKAIEETLIIIGKNLIPIGDSYRPTLMKRLPTL